MEFEPTQVPAGCQWLPAATQRRALDWSLVLASQGIQVSIEHGATAGWGLVVLEAEAEPARRAIALYEKENAHWPWQKPILDHRAVFDWAATLWLAAICLAYQLQSSWPRFYDAGVLDRVAVAHGQWWRCLTAEFLHGDVVHLASNAAFGMILLGLAMGRFGSGIGLLAAFLAGAVGNVFSWVVMPEPHHSLGASGLVMGALGLLAAPVMGESLSPTRRWKTMLGSLVAGLMLFVLLGLHPGSDMAAHFGGFGAGAIFGLILARFPSLPRRAGANSLASVVFLGMVGIAWWLALRNHYPG